MPFKDPEKRREAVRKSCKKAYWANPEKGRAKAMGFLRANRDRYRENALQRRHADPEKWNARSREWRAAHPEVAARYRRTAMLKKHGLTLEDYERMHAEQNGLCIICGRPETTKKNGKVQLLTVEHCHRTSKVRGLTCNRCNRGMGMFGDDPALLRAAASYLDA